MGKGCIGICTNYNASGSVGSGLPRYRENIRYCGSCTLRIRWDGVKCPCCGNILRTKAQCGDKRKKRNIGVFRY